MKSAFNNSHYLNFCVEKRLTEEQVSDVIDGKCVLGPPQDIREVQNAYEACGNVLKLNAYSVRDILKELSHNGVMNKAKTLDEKILNLLAEDGTQSAAGLAEIVGASPRTVQSVLKRLMDDGKIEHVGPNRFGHYIVK